MIYPRKQTTLKIKDLKTSRKNDHIIYNGRKTSGGRLKYMEEFNR